MEVLGILAIIVGTLFIGAIVYDLLFGNNNPSGTIDM